MLRYGRLENGTIGVIMVWHCRRYISYDAEETSITGVNYPQKGRSITVQYRYKNCF